MTVSWAQALARRVPPLRNAYLLRRRPAIGPLAAVIDEWLLADWEVLRKQPPTAPAGVRQRLVAEAHPEPPAGL